jgi:hypothetical protein
MYQISLPLNDTVMIRREFPEVIILSDLAASSQTTATSQMSYNELQLRVG